MTPEDAKRKLNELVDICNLKNPGDHLNVLAWLVTDRIEQLSEIAKQASVPQKQQPSVEPLGDQFEKVLHENRWNLYENESAHQAQQTGKKSC